MNEDKFEGGWAQMVSEFRQASVLIRGLLYGLAAWGAGTAMTLLVMFIWNAFLSYEFALRPLTWEAAGALLAGLLVLIAVMVGLKSDKGGSE